MKVQIHLQASKIEASSKFSLTVNPEDTIHSIKERIAASQLIAFPDQDLALDGQVLEEKKMLSDYGVKEGNTLDFMIRASEESLNKQLSELLQARDLTCDELGLLYCYKHGVSINQALKTIGHTEKFQDFVKVQKGFMVESGRVSLVRKDTALKPFSVADEIKRILEETNSGSMDVTSLCSKFIQKFNVSIASIVNMRPVDFLEKEKDLFVMTGRGQVALKSAIQQAPQPKKEVPQQKKDVPQQKKESKPAAKIPTASLDVNETVKLESSVKQESSDSQQYLELHNKISGRSFNSKIVQTLNDVVEVVTEKSFLNISQVVKGGSVGKGTAIIGTTDATVVFFLKGMPHGQHNLWLPPLLKAVAGVLEEHLGAGHGIEDIYTTADSVDMKVKGLVEMSLKFSPAIESYAEVVQAMGVQGPGSRKFFASSLIQEKVQFISKQPGQVKVTMRLLKWWRDQQRWSSQLTRPSDDILELIAVYSALQTKPSDQRMAIANAMSLMARFDELRIVWSNYYGKDDIWAPLLHQRPLLMDPVNPFVNVADPQTFDAAELMSCAQTTHFFW